MERNVFSRSSLRNSLRKLTVVAIRRQSPVLGEVDVGVEALHLLESAEETVTPVIIKVTSAPLLQEVHKANVVAPYAASKHQSVNTKCEDSEGDTEEDDRFPEVVLRRHPVRDVLLSDVIYALLNLQPHSQDIPDVPLDNRENQCKPNEETFPGTNLKDVKRRRRRSLIDLRTGSKEIKKERRRSFADGRGLSAYNGSEIGSRSYNEAGASQEEILKLLREVFEVDDETLIEIERQVRQREPPKITVHVEIVEAKDLKPKANLETRNPFCLVHVAGSTETFRTRTLFSTLQPQWDSRFSTGITNPQDCKVTVDIWHEPQDTPGFQKHLQRVKDTINQNEKRNLLGSVTVPVGIFCNRGNQGGYGLSQDVDEKTVARSVRQNGSKVVKNRGSLHLRITQSTVSQTTLPGRSGYDSLLSKLTTHHLGLLGNLGGGGGGGSLDRRSTIKSNWSHQSNGSSISSSSSLSSSPSDGEPGSVQMYTPWKGNLSHVSTLVLNQYGAVTSVSPASQALIHWKVASRMHNADQSFLLNLIKQMKIHLVEGLYSEEELKELKTSLRLWVTGCEESIRSLHINYPSTSRLLSHHQLTNTLQCLNFLDYEPSYRLLQPYVTDSTVTDVITDALACHTKSWWEKAIQMRGRNSPTASEEQQLIGAAGVASECYGFLTEIQQFYGDIFAREMNVSHLRISYILLSGELSARVRPLLIKLYDYSGPRQQSQSRMEIVEGKDALALELGTPIWHLFKNLEKIVRIGDKLPDEVLLQSGLRNYHQWFAGGVNRWEQRTIARAKYFLKEEVDKEEFNMGPDCRSSSSSEASYIFRVIKSSWDKLAWPDHKEARVYRARVIENLCGLGTQYSRQVAGKLAGLLREENKSEENFLSKQLCVGLNNINYLCQEVEKLLDLFEVDEHEDEENVTAVVQDASDTMRDAINDFLDSTTRKLRPVLSSAVSEACMMANEAPLLASVLDDGLATLKRHLDVVNFQWFLIRLWRVLIEVFRNIVDENSNRRTATFFEDVFKILERTWQFFTPGDQYSLNPQEARTIEYLGLLNTLENLKMPTEALIAKYFREKADEQDRVGNPAVVAKLYVRGFFTRTGKLTIEIIMAKDITLENNRNHKSRSTMIRQGSSSKPDTYVQITLVPQLWFPNIGTHRTKVERKNEEPVYEGQFEFRISHTDEGARSGHVLFTLKQHNLLQNDIVVGETVLPLEKLRCVDTADVRSVSNMILNVTSARGDDDCTALRALQVRTWDKQAVSFLKDLKKKRKLTTTL
ncbi:unnamed protein product, partial [Meganyctiphanes norvegica]